MRTAPTPSSEADNHKGETELKDAKPASKTEKGYTGDKVCKDCGVVLEKGEEIPVIVEDDKQEEKPEQTPGSGDAGDNDNAGAGSEDLLLPTPATAHLSS